MPHLCWNGNLCKFKPKCHFSHPEGGNRIKTKGNSGKILVEKPIEDPLFLKRFPNYKFLDKTDYEAVKKLVQQQVDLLGSDRLYRRVDKNLFEHKFDAFFAIELFELYAWRIEFFYTTFGHSNQRNSSDVLTWYTDSLDDEPEQTDTVPYQITKNFDNVMALACSSENNRNAKTSIYFESNETLSVNAMFKFDSDIMMTVLVDSAMTEIDLQEEGMSFSDVVHAIVAMHRPGPCTLLEAAMKAVLLHDLPLLEIPKELQKKAAKGLYSLDGPIPELAPNWQNFYHEFRDYCEESKGKSMWSWMN